MGIEAGADDFITKPFRRMELRARLRTITRLNRYRHLLAERAQMNWILEQAHEGHLIIDETDEILYANARAASFLGFSDDSRRTGRETFLSLARRHYRCEPEEAWCGWPDRAGMTRYGSRFMVRRGTGAEGACWLKVTIFERTLGSRTNWLICLRDVTDEVASRNNRWSFESMLSHKLRTPLSIIRTPLSMLTKQVSRLTADETSDLARMALEGFDRLEGEIKDILSYVEAPGSLFEGSSFPMKDLASLLGELRHDLGLADMKLTIQEETGGAHLALPRQAVTRQAVTLILWELLENAKKFHPTSTPLVEVRAVVSSESFARLQVGDDGITLPAPRLNDVWEPYYQYEDHFTGQVAGMGLGLSSVASLIWQAGGQCRLYNRENGTGIVVELDIPLAAPQPGI